MCSFAGISSASPCGRAADETRRFVPHQSDLWRRTAHERICRASSRLTTRVAGSNPVAPIVVRQGVVTCRHGRETRGAMPLLLRLHGCRSDARADRARADAWISSGAAVSSTQAQTPACARAYGTLDGELAPE
jgi:hypothetical protein